MIRVLKEKMGKMARFYSLKRFAVRQESAKLSSWVQFPSSPLIVLTYSGISQKLVILSPIYAGCGFAIFTQYIALLRVMVRVHAKNA